MIFSETGPTSLGYGLGWFLEPQRGHRVVDHGGSIDGMLTAMTLLPEGGTLYPSFRIWT